MLRILMVADHGCIRVVKESLALRAKGHWVELLTRQEPFGYNRLDRVTLWHDRDQLIRAVRDSRADIVHVHNEPDWIVAAAREGTSRPLVYDIHDLESLRMQTAPNTDEMAAFAAADGYVHVSEACQQRAQLTHPPHAGKPACVLPCYVNEEFYAKYPPWSSSDSVVYEGGLQSSHDTYEEHGQTIVGIRSLMPVVEAAIAAGLHVGLCPAAPLSDFAYMNAGAAVWGPLPYNVMLRTLRPYGWGFVGATHDMPLMHAAMPNKLFEYLSQGVVPVVYRATAAAQFVTENACGFVLPALDDWSGLNPDDHEVLRTNVLDLRWQWTMERHIDKVEQVYRDVLDAKSRIRGIPVTESADDDLGVPV